MTPRKFRFSFQVYLIKSIEHVSRWSVQQSRELAKTSELECVILRRQIDVWQQVMHIHYSRIKGLE